MEQIAVLATVAQLNAVLDFVTEQARKTGMDIKSINECVLATEEIFINISNYAYTPDSGYATVGAKMDDSNFLIEFKDNGIKYNPLNREDPDIMQETEGRVPGGLGIFLAKKLMDEVSYVFHDGQNVLTMRKDIRMHNALL